MTTRAHVFVIIVSVLAVVFVLFLVRRHSIKSKYSLLWIAISLVLLVVATFPSLYDRISDGLGILYPPATILFISVAILFVVVVHFSWELSRLEERSRILAEELALLRARTEADALGEHRGDVQTGTETRSPSADPRSVDPGSGSGSGSIS